VTARLRELAALVLRDLDVSRAAEGGGDGGTGAGRTTPVLSFSELPGDGLVEVMLSDADGMGCGFGVDPRWPDERVLYEMADRMPDAYVELFRVGVPVVPGTRRPAVPRAGGEAGSGGVVWADPLGATGWSCPVGRYPG
jgi:hypothetical protein